MTHNHLMGHCSALYHPFECHTKVDSSQSSEVETQQNTLNTPPNEPSNTSKIPLGPVTVPENWRPAEECSDEEWAKIHVKDYSAVVHDPVVHDPVPGRFTLPALKRSTDHELRDYLDEDLSEMYPKLIDSKMTLHHSENDGNKVPKKEDMEKHEELFNAICLEENLPWMDKDEIYCIMQQAECDMRTAMKALKEQGNIVDAILSIVP